MTSDAETVGDNLLYACLGIWPHVGRSAGTNGRPSSFARWDEELAVVEDDAVVEVDVADGADANPNESTALELVGGQLDVRGAPNASCWLEPESPPPKAASPNAPPEDEDEDVESRKLEGNHDGPAGAASGAAVGSPNSLASQLLDASDPDPPVLKPVPTRTEGELPDKSLKVVPLVLGSSRVGMSDGGSLGSGRGPTIFTGAPRTRSSWDHECTCATIPIRSPRKARTRGS